MDGDVSISKLAILNKAPSVNLSNVYTLLLRETCAKDGPAARLTTKMSNHQKDLPRVGLATYPTHCSKSSWHIMFSWNEDRQANEKAIVIKVLHFTAGLYFWEFLTTLDFEWSFISRRRAFKWPMLFYFLNRYCYLAAITCLLYTEDAPLTTRINCGALYNFIQIAGNMAVGFASLNLAIRTIAIWSGNKYVITALTIMMLGQWALIFQGGSLQHDWVYGLGCADLQTNNKVLAATYSLSTFLDTVVLVLSAWKLRILAKAVQSSKLVTMLFRDGLIYFIVALLGNIVVVIFEVLNIDPIFDVIFNIPSVAVITIAATRAVRNLQEQLSTSPETIIPSAAFTTRFPSIESPMSVHTYQSVYRSRQYTVDMESLVIPDPNRDKASTYGEDGSQMRKAQLTPLLY
ncbi:unnamed protein product [Somion occarium]|uniref:Transmembrane protein n=1 Tax=Somion occarium TaxID=3059160 RepID=A0ABP1DLF7_9APHY